MRRKTGEVTTWLGAAVGFVLQALLYLAVLAAVGYLVAGAIETITSV